MKGTLKKKRNNISGERKREKKDSRRARSFKEKELGAVVEGVKCKEQTFSPKKEGKRF